MRAIVLFFFNITHAFAQHGISLHWDSEVGCLWYEGSSEIWGIDVDQISDDQCITVCEGSTVNFTLYYRDSLNRDAIDGVSWSSNGGNIVHDDFYNSGDTLATAEVTWPNPQENGSITVKIQGSEEFAVTLCVTIKAKPEADFEVIAKNNEYYCDHTDIYFDNLSKAHDGSRIISNVWDFDDGHFSSAKEPVHSYEEPGTYEVSLTVYDECSCSSPTAPGQNPRPTNHYQKIIIMKLKSVIICLLSLFLTFPLTAQDLSRWQWTKRGGGPGTVGSLPSIFTNDFQRVVDMAIDSDDNYYFLAILTGDQYSDLVDYEGKKLHPFNNGDNDSDIYVVSTDSTGKFRWDKMIGGGASDYPISINVDAGDNVYVSGTTWNIGYGYNRVHFDTDTIKGYITHPEDQPDPMNKDIFLIKYDQTGQFQWLSEPEGVKNTMVDPSDWGGVNAYNAGVVKKTVVEPDGTAHSLMELGEGQYFNGQLTVPLGERQPVIVTYDSSGNRQRFITVDMKNTSEDNYYGVQMAYDAHRDRYYIADRQTMHTDTLGINGYGGPTDRAFYLAAVDNRGKVVWYEDTEKGSWNSLGDLQLDPQGNIYFSGKIYSKGKFAGHTFPNKDVPFLVKFDPSGKTLWTASGKMSSPFPAEAIVLDTVTNSVYLAMPSLANEWGDITTQGPYLEGWVPDPVIVRLDAATGKAMEGITLPETSGYSDGYTVLGMDHGGNLVGGGFFGGDLFYGPDLGISAKNTNDFFMLKYRPYDHPCSVPEDFAIEKQGNSSVKLSWSPVNGESRWVINYGDDYMNPITKKPEFVPTEHLGVWDTIIGTPEVTLDNLDPDTNYLFFIQAICDSTHKSDFTKRRYFKINDLPGDTCAAPQTVHIDSITNHTARIFWTPAAGEQQWRLNYGKSGFDPHTEGHRLTVSGSPDTTLTNLERDTGYEVYIRVHCGGYSYSGWNGPGAFTTKDLGVESKKRPELTFYPNPTTGLLNIESVLPLKDYTLYDLRGRTVKSGALPDNRVDLSGLGPGLYLLSVRSTEGKVRRVKIVKE